MSTGTAADGMNGVQQSQQPHARIFSFGDSLTDTGNVLRMLGEQMPISRPPQRPRVGRSDHDRLSR
jgi:hypothetical protein